MISSFDALSSNGAPVSLNGDGSFNYDSTAAPALLALAGGVDLVDTVNYTLEDVSGLQDTATVSIAVSGWLSIAGIQCGSRF